MTLADMHLTHPAARGLRLIYVLQSDRLWFTLAVLMSLLASYEVAQLLIPAAPPPVEGGYGL